MFNRPRRIEMSAVSFGFVRHRRTATSERYEADLTLSLSILVERPVRPLTALGHRRSQATGAPQDPIIISDDEEEEQQHGAGHQAATSRAGGGEVVTNQVRAIEAGADRAGDSGVVTATPAVAIQEAAAEMVTVQVGNAEAASSSTGNRRVRVRRVCKARVRSKLAATDSDSDYEPGGSTTRKSRTSTRGTGTKRSVSSRSATNEGPMTRSRAKRLRSDLVADNQAATTDTSTMSAPDPYTIMIVDNLLASMVYQIGSENKDNNKNNNNHGDDDDDDLMGLRLVDWEELGRWSPVAVQPTPAPTQQQEEQQQNEVEDLKGVSMDDIFEEW